MRTTLPVNIFSRLITAVLILTASCGPPPKPGAAWRHSSYAEKLEAAIQQLAKEISGKDFLSLGNFLLAVPEVTSHDHLPRQFRLYISDRLIHHLTNENQCRILERMQFYKIVEEYRLEQNNLFDPASRQTLMIAGVDAILIGTVLVQGERLEIFARLVMLETGQAVISVRQTAPRDVRFIKSFR